MLYYKISFWVWAGVVLLALFGIITTLLGVQA